MAYRIQVVKSWPRESVELYRNPDGSIVEYSGIDAAEAARRRLIEEYARSTASVSFRLVDMIGEEDK